MKYSIFLLFISVLSFSQEYQKMAYPINTIEHNEYSPSISYDGKTLIYEADNSGRWRLYQSHKMGEKKWSKPRPIEEINELMDKSKFVGGAFQTYDGKYLLFTTDQEPGFGNMDIWIAEKVGNKWENARNFSEQINSVFFDGFPSLSPDGEVLYFMRNVRAGEMSENSACYFIYKSKKKKNGEWGTPEMLPNPVNMFCEECPRILPDGKTLLFSSSRQGGTGGWDIYKTYLNENGKWENPENLSFLNTPFDDKLATVAADGEAYYYAVTNSSQMDDIYFAKAPKKEEFANAIQLVCRLFDIETKEKISGAKIEIIPIKDTASLYILTENETGGIYKNFLEKGRNYSLLTSAQGYSFFSEDIFLEAPEFKISNSLNSGKELSELWNELILNESQKEKQTKADKKQADANQILKVEIQKLDSEISLMDVQVEDAKNAQARKKLYENQKELRILKHKKIWESYENSYSGNNQYFSLLEELLETYRVESNKSIKENGQKWEQKAEALIKKAEAEWEKADELKVSNDFLPYGKKTKNFQQKALRAFLTAFEYYMTFHNFNASLIEKDIYLTPLKKDASIQLSNISFDFDKATLNKSSYPELQKLISLLNEHQGIKVELSAHTDNLGTHEYNENLSDHRAQSVVDYLVKNGIEINRLEAIGYGESKPLVLNDTEENMAKNRRVEFKILEISD